MRHRRAGRKLNRNATHRLALYRNLSCDLIHHEKIKTTLPKAKALRPFVEKLITLAKKAAVEMEKGDAGRIKALHYRRQAIAKLGPMNNRGIYDDKGNLTESENDTILKKLFNELGPRFVDRPGGYTRVLKLQVRRLGDAGEQAIIELLKEGETKVQRASTAQKPAVAPAPVVTETPAAPAVEEPAPTETNETPDASAPATEESAPEEKKDEAK